MTLPRMSGNPSKVRLNRQTISLPRKTIMTSTQTFLEVDIPRTQAIRYPIVLEPGSIHQTGRITALALGLQPGQARKALIVTDTNVGPLYARLVTDSLSTAGFQAQVHTVNAGEQAKCRDEAEAIYTRALSMGLSRKDVMIALGGGVVGDLTGYCAATFYRGVPFVQVPTSLLAQVDSSVGGKVAINFKSAKNGIGTFYQPIAVIADPDTLNTLPQREWLAGLAEVVKYALIEQTCTGESGFFETLMNASSHLKANVSAIVRQCCAIKAAVVAQDETETSGIRSYLNLGHTFAHAYEEITEYQMLLHGEAVAIGLRLASETALRRNLIDAETHHKTMALLNAYQLGIAPPPGLDPERLLDLMRHDKKTSAGAIRLILPNGPIGHVGIYDDTDDALIMDVLQTA
jgi:3-dehydroquinate synthase